ncbi:MAG TPA: LamG-like jellyroll fold domain-containing protein [Pyrinomonadaceae bacterium]|nr:LamG-like jellyroll fold domain-containing protein [Pyrinomonadaceae bacterium]
MRPLVCFSLLFAGLVLAALPSTERSTSAQLRPEVLQCTTPPPGMVAWWPGEGNGNDIRGENNGTLNGSPTFPAGEVGQAFGLNGTNQFVSIPDSPSLRLTNLTIDAWVNPTDLTQDRAILIKSALSSGGNDFAYGLRVLSGGHAEGRITDAGGAFASVVSTSVLSTNQFQHIALTYDGAALKLYVNGVLDATTATNLTPVQNTNPVSIGVWQSVSAGVIQYWFGRIDEVELFSRGLTQTEIQNIFNAGTAGKCRPRCLTPPSGLISWYTGDDNPFDIFGTNHGTLQGGATFGNGKVGRAFSMAGGSDFVSLGNPATLKLTRSITIDAWINPNTLSAGQLEDLVTKWSQDTTCGSGTSNSYFLALQDNGVNGVTELLGVINQPTTGSAALIGGNIPAGVWSHVAMTYDQASGAFALYVNGVSVASSTVATTGLCTSNIQVQFGSEDSNQGPSRRYSGRLDEVEIFNRALSASEIQAINNAASAGKCKPCLAPPANMVGWWNGDANTRDDSGSGNNGTLQGTAAFALGKVSQAFSFDGSGAAVSVADAPSLHLTTQLTIDAWVNPTDLTSGPLILSKFNGGQNSYELEVQADGAVRANVSSNGTTLDALISGPSLVSTGAWSHVATTFNAGDFRIYVNGIQVTSKTSTVTSIFPGTATLFIGRDSGTTHNFTGLIDEVEVFSRALTQTEIQSIVAAGASGKCKSTCPAIPVFAANPGGQTSTVLKSPCFLLTGNHPDANETDLVGDAAVTVNPTNAGSTDYQTLDIYSAGPMPFGYGIPIEIADISTTKTFTGNATVCFNLQAVSDMTTFNQLRVLHLEGNLLIDRTSSHYFAQRSLCATTSSLSPFVISQSPNAPPTAANGNIGGTITDSSGAPVSGVTLTLSGTESREAITDSSGHYSFDNVETNGFYTVTPLRVNFTFSPANRSFSLLGVHTEASFTATANGAHLNAIDTTEFFVRQQYLDFLGREPDPPGFIGWVNTIRNCAPNDTSCDRVHVSEMFYRSQEFQERGYFAYRFYSTALGRKPDYAEFVPDLQRVSGFLTNDQLEAAKVALVDDFMSRPAFARQYDSLSDTAFVDKLLQTAGVDLPNRQALIDALRTRRLRRAQVLRQIAESGEVYQRYYNQAFVVMEYFGYLRRDPDSLYLNWIDVLNQGGDPRHMVEGFVSSAEYRNRFVP